MSQLAQTSGRAEVRGVILSRLDTLYHRALEADNLSLCVRILDLMAKLNGLYDKSKKSSGPEKITLDDFTEDTLSHLMEEVEQLEKLYETKSYNPSASGIKHKNKKAKERIHPTLFHRKPPEKIQKTLINAGRSGSPHPFRSGDDEQQMRPKPRHGEGPVAIQSFSIKKTV